MTSRTEHQMYSVLAQNLSGRERGESSWEESRTTRPTYRVADFSAFRQVTGLRSRLRDGTDPALRGLGRGLEASG